MRGQDLGVRRRQCIQPIQLTRGNQALLQGACLRRGQFTGGQPF
jgi:hypothetical protein